jgi:hypothetical protein
LAERVEQLAAYRSAELRHASEMKGTEDAGERSARTQRFVLGIVSLATGIPITAVSANLVDPSLLGVMVSWAGIVGVNIAAGLRRR